MIPKEQIEDIKSRVSLSQFLSDELGGLQKAKRNLAGNKVTCCCPFHDDKKPSFQIDDDKGHWNCWSSSCGSGDIFSAIGKIRGLEFYQAVSYVAEAIGYDLKHENSNAPRRASTDVSIFSNALYRHFKLSDFNEKRNKLLQNDQISPMDMIGAFRCLDSKREGWITEVGRDLELKQSLINLGYDLEYFGLLDQSFVLHPIWRLKQDSYASPSTVARTIPTANGPVDMEVVGFRVYDNNGKLEGTFPQGAILASSVSVPVLSFQESLCINTDELVVSDNYQNHLENISAGRFNSICVGSELNYAQVNSLLKLAGKTVSFECTQAFFQNHRNRSALISMGARMLGENRHGKIKLTDHNIEIDLVDHCLLVTQTTGFGEEDFFSLADFYVKFVKSKGLGSSLPHIFKSIVGLHKQGYSPIEFIDNFLLKRVNNQEALLNRYGDFVAMYGRNRQDPNIDKEIKYFDLSVEQVLGLDLKEAINLVMDKKKKAGIEMS